MYAFLKKNKKLALAVLLFIFFSIWWLKDTPGRSSPYFLGEFENVYGFLALWGGMGGMIIANGWGGHKTVIGRAV